MIVYTRKKVAGILLTLGCLVCYIVSSITYMIIKPVSEDSVTPHTGS